MDLFVDGYLEGVYKPFSLFDFASMYCNNNSQYNSYFQLQFEHFYLKTTMNFPFPAPKMQNM